METQNVVSSLKKNRGKVLVALAATALVITTAIGSIIIWKRRHKTQTNK